MVMGLQVTVCPATLEKEPRELLNTGIMIYPNGANVLQTDPWAFLLPFAWLALTFYFPR